MIDVMLPALLFSLPVIGASLHLYLSHQKNETATNVCQIILSGLFFLLGVFLFVKGGNLSVIHVANWLAPYGISIVFDGLSKLMILTFSIVMLCINIYSLQDTTLGCNHGQFYAGSWLLCLGIMGSVSTYDIFNLYVWSEVMLVSAFIILASTQKNNIDRIWQYALFNIMGTLVMLLAIALIYGATGSLHMAEIAKQFQSGFTPQMQISVMLLMLGLAVKGGIFPFYFWLPDSYPSTSASSTMMLSSLNTKAVMIVMLRLVWLWQLTQFAWMQNAFIFLACCTMFFGVMGAANNFRIRDILSFHIVSQLGYIFLAIIIPSSTAIVAVLFFLIHNLFVKTSLLLCSGIIEQRYGTCDLSELGQIIKACPLLAGLFFISAMSLAGFPPLSGFWGKLLILKVAYHDELYVALLVALVVSLFTMYSMIKIWRYAYCELADTVFKDYETFKLSKIQLLSLVLLCAVPLIIGIFPNSLLEVLSAIAAQVSQPRLMLDAVLGGGV